MVHSLYQSLNNLETIYADRIGIRYYDEAKGGVVEVPFRQYAADLRRFVAFLRSRTPNPLGQRVAILARNSYHYVMCLYGAVLAGAVAVPLNTGKNWDEIRYELDLVKEMAHQRKGNKIAVVYNHDCEGIEELADYPVQIKVGADMENVLLGLDFILFAQTIALMKSLSLGITPDNPCPTGEVNRVVKGVTLYPYTLK